MNTGMEEEVALRKSENIFDAPLLSCRDKAKIERNKRNQERQREVLLEEMVLERLLFSELWLIMQLMEFLRTARYCMLNKRSRVMTQQLCSVH
uniref:Uncharacterized protein n=1 Tax=Aegilops tauschii subsp. strangulata TaxID=200361 RepID=A0A453Q561_AEGTS